MSGKQERPSVMALIIRIPSLSVVGSSLLGVETGDEVGCELEFPINMMAVYCCTCLWDEQAKHIVSYFSAAAIWLYPVTHSFLVTEFVASGK
jgi:hypothetical protein